MSDHKQRQAVATLLLEYVNKGDVSRVESHLSQFKDDSQWRYIIRCEFPIQELMADVLQYDLSLPRLLSYEIGTLSPFHYAALRGLNDILMNFVDHDVPVDVALESGTTALHLAAFGGKADCVKMLLEIYKAELNKQDRYGWSALHYASTEGQYEVVKILVEAGIDRTTRDQDGTTAAYRAHVNGYRDIVLLLAADDAELLAVQPVSDRREFDSLDDIYSQLGTKHTTMTRNKTLPHNSSMTPQKTKSPLRHTASMPADLKDNRKSIIRRLIQEELESFDDTNSCYLQPSAARQPSAEEAQALKSIGPNTLKGVLREEISKFAKQIFASQASAEYGQIMEELPSDLGPAPKPPTPSNNRDYETIYETVKMASTPPPSTTSADDDADDEPEGGREPQSPPPPLPPRVISTSQDDADREPKDLLQLSVPSDSAALSASLSRIAEVIGGDWKKLAYQLPLEKTPAKTQDRVDKIEKRHPGDLEKQAALALAEWRLNRGPAADVDCLIIALRKCGLHNLIEEVDRATQEFTA